MRYVCSGTQDPFKKNARQLAIYVRKKINWYELDTHTSLRKMILQN